MLMVGGVFVAIGFLLNLGALFLELTQFHPALEQFFGQFTQHSWLSEDRTEQEAQH